MLGKESKTTVSVSKPVDTDSPVTGQWIKMSGNQKTPQFPWPIAVQTTPT